MSIQGIISLWSGAIIDIPIGWVLCDGNNGSPDLTDKFVIGAGDTYNPGDSGGSETHDHTFTGDNHAHNFVAGAAIAAGADKAGVTDSEAPSGTTASSNHMPPMYALAFIMKT